MVNLAVMLKKVGYLIDFAVYQDIGFYEPVLKEHGIIVNKIPDNSKLRRVFAVRAYIRKNKPDAVIAFLEVPCFLACFAKVGGGKFKVVTTELSAKLTTFRSLRNKIFNWFERYSSAKVCNSENARKLWEKYCPQYHDKYEVIYNPVIMKEKPCEEFAFLKGGKIRIVVAASYQELKGPLRLIEAIRGLDLESRSHLVVDWYGCPEVVTGNTEVFDKAVEQIKAFGLGDQIHLHSETSDIYTIMNQADMIGLFSTIEGLPNAICEAMMVGKPVLMSNVSDYQVLTDGNGISFAPTVEGIRQGLLTALSCNAEQLKEMGRKSLEKAERLFSPDIILKQWIEVIEK